MSSSFVRKTEVIVRSLFSFVVMLQEESHIERFTFRFIYCTLIPRYSDILDEVKYAGF